MRAAPVLKLLIAVLLSTAAVAVAQEDEILQRYQLAQDNLAESRARVLADPEASMGELQLAFAALRHIALEAGRDDVPAAFTGVVERARQATANRSTPDHQIQTELLRAGLRKALFESALSSWEEEQVTARARLAQLLSELGASEEEAALAQDANRRTVASAVQALAAARAAEALLGTPEPRPDSRAPTYRVLAVAYGHYLLLQDSQFADPALDAGFAAAAEATVEADSERLAQVLNSLREGLGRAAEAATDATIANTAVPVTGTAIPAETSSRNESRTEATAAPKLPSLLAQAATGEPPESSAGAVVGKEVGGGVPAPVGVAESDEVAKEVGQDARTPVNAVAATTPVEAAATATPVETAATATPVEDSGTPMDADVPRAIDDLYASTGRYLLAIQEGRLGDASASLADFERRYQQAVAPSLIGADGLLHDRIANLLRTLRASPQPRTVDAGALLVQIAAAERALLADAPDTRAELVAVAAGNWSGWTRSLVWSVLALLAFLPLYLLNLAFGGGGNRNWRLVGISLLLLLAVPIYEGARSLLAIAAELSGVSALQILAPYSLVDTPVGQLAWAAMTALAILLASLGLYGICMQFGLIRDRKRPEDARRTLVTRAATSGAEAVVDWDEEF